MSTLQVCVAGHKRAKVLFCLCDDRGLERGNVRAKIGNAIQREKPHVGGDLIVATAPGM